MKLIEISPDEVGSALLRTQLADIHAVVRGAELSPDNTLNFVEPRESLLLDAAAQLGIPVFNIRIGVPTIDVVADAKDRFLISAPDKTSELLAWYQLADWLHRKWAGKHLLLDLTTLSGSSIFQLHAAAIKAACVGISYLYTTPIKYPQVDKPDDIPPLVTRSIKQPHGYRSFAHEQSAGSRKHIIVLGFDRHRPNKFIEHYQWPTEEVHVILGTPAYVGGGEEQARLSLGPIYHELDKIKHVHTVDPKLPAQNGETPGVADLLQKLTTDEDIIDLVPLGPKPTLLGCLMYWHGLSDERKERTRFLFDFPIMRQVRTEGVGVTWLYRDVLSAD